MKTNALLLFALASTTVLSIINFLNSPENDLLSSDASSVAKYTSRIHQLRSEYIAPLPLDWKQWAQDIHKKWVFLHIGKAGGTTIFCRIAPPATQGFNFFCRRNAKAPFHTEKYGRRAHMDNQVKRKDVELYEVYLTGLRNPITRFISAFNYEKLRSNKWIHKKEPTFYKCFHSYSIEKFLNQGLLLSANASSVGNSSTDLHHCQTTAIEFTRGQIKSLQSHVTYNFEYYEQQFLFASQIRSDLGRSPARLVAIATETMAQDFESIDTLFQTGKLSVSTTTTKKNNNTTATITAMNANNRIKFNDTTIQQSEYKTLCYHLCRGIQAYKRLMYRSENLNKEHIQERILELNQFCPLETIELRNDCD